MSSPPDERALRLAAVIADELDVDWDHEQDAAGLPSLHRVERVVQAFRDLRRRGGDELPAPREADALFVWGQLQVLERLGEGGFGEVYRAWDPLLEREVALKLRRQGPSQPEGGGERFVAEARRLARVRHANVLAIHGADCHDGRIGLWTELVEGCTLEERLRREGPAGPDEAVVVGLAVCRALAAIHAAGLVHGDVKAANVLREQGGRIVLADLGSALEIAGGGDGADRVSLSPATAPPEVLWGARPGPLADIYSLGALLYRLLSGSLPIQAEDLPALLAGHEQGAARPLRDLRPDLPAALVQVVERALAHRPEDRFASAGEMERALAGALRPDAAAEPSVAPATPRRPTWIVVGAAVLALVAGATVLLLRDPAGRSPRAQASPPRADASSVPAAAAPAVAEARPEAETVAAPLTLDATLFRRRGADVQALSAAGSVTLGDHLYLEVAAAEAVHLYVVNEDQEGALFVLFPLPDLDLGNPLPNAVRHRLPGRRHGEVLDWQVTSVGGVERFLVAAARDPLPELERLLAGSPAADPSRALSAGGERRQERGVGGVVESGPAAADGPGGRLQALHDRLRASRDDRELWLRRFEVANPVPGMTK